MVRRSDCNTNSVEIENTNMCEMCIHHKIHFWSYSSLLCHPIMGEQFPKVPYVLPGKKPGGKDTIDV